MEYINWMDKKQAFNLGGLIMPLVKGQKAKTRAGFSENIKREMKAGKKQPQAVAIAYAMTGKKRKSDILQAIVIEGL